MRPWVPMLVAALTFGSGAGLPGAEAGLTKINRPSPPHPTLTRQGKGANTGLIKINGAIGPATATYIARAIDAAAARKDGCLIIQLDTPGGLLDSTRDIVQKLYDSKLPIVVYVAPAPPRAGSAGVFI